MDIRRFLLALALLCASLGVACQESKEPPPLPPVLPTVEVVAGSTAPTSPPADAPAADHILHAQSLILRNHVDELDGDALLEAAWKGARERVEEDGIELPAGLAPRWRNEPEENVDVLRQALTTLEGLSAGHVSTNEIAVAAITEMADSLVDDHTYFLAPKAWERYQTGRTLGFGYSTLRRADGLLVWYIIAGGTADRIGLKPGDVVRRIDGQPAAPPPDERSITLEPGVSVRLEVERPGVGVLALDATPEVYDRPIINSSLMSGGIAYVRLFRFPSARQMPPGQVFPAYLDDILHRLRDQGARAWILDMRNNPGGSESAAAVVAGRMGLDGALIENRGRGGKVSTLQSDGESAIGDAQLVILINERSSSSSELVAGSLQDAGRAYVMGAKSSGIVNTSRTFEVAGGGLFVTTQRAYAGPEKRYLNAAGVFPDEVVSLSRSELARGRDTQLEAALAYLESRINSAVGSR